MKNLGKKALAVALLSMAMMSLSTGNIAAEELKKSDKKPVKVVEKKKQARPLIQIAILLDTSGSMQGLINQAKTQLWKIVNELATTKKNGIRPRLQVALYEYGKSSLPSQEGFLRMIVSLTDDLDKVSEELFALRTNGGSEYCGWVIKQAVKELAWSKSNGDYKAIYIAGNEPFTQGNVHYEKACRSAIAKGIVVNTIFCGNFQRGVSGKWQHGAKLADGSYMNIDHNAKVRHIPTPYDKKIAALSRKVNGTYVPYGRGGQAGKARQKKQDSNAKGAAPAAEAQRALSKASGYYNASNWDLIDGVKNGKIKIKDLKEKHLPKELKGKSKEEIKKYIEEKLAERKKIQEEIKRLGQLRKKFIAKERKKDAKNGRENSLDKAMIKSLHEQLKKKKFNVK